MKIRRCLRIAAINDNDGEVTVRDAWVDVDESAAAATVAAGHLSAPWVLSSAEWVEMPGQESLL